LAGTNKLASSLAELFSRALTTPPILAQGDGGFNIDRNLLQLYPLLTPVQIYKLLEWRRMHPDGGKPGVFNDWARRHNIYV
jgi:hypothetical protein